MRIKHTPIFCLLAALLCMTPGCESDSPRTTAVSGAPPDAETMADLATRPLYNFTEQEVDRYLRYAREAEPDLAQRIIHLGRKNIGQPYDIYLLGEFPYEFHDPDPIYCLGKSDCLTFAEHMYAMALSRDWWEFLRALQRLRYRDGEISMLTRNHYTIADWNRNNAFIFEDLTAGLGAGEACVPLTQVCRRAPFFKQFGIGQDIPDEPISDLFIPKDKLPLVLNELRDGDFVNIIRGDENSQWCGHTGLVAIADDGTVDFLHSARPAVREQPLIEYVNGDRRCVGVKFLRLRPDAERIMAETPSPLATPVSESALQAALDASPLLTDGYTAIRAPSWINAMHLQAYRLTPDAPSDPSLQAALENLDQQIGAELGIPEADRAFGVLDISDLRLAMVRPDEMFYGASVPKICILLTYFHQHPEAATDLDPEIERELKLMIKRSDNEIAAKYSQLVGLDAIQELLQSKRYRFYDAEHGGGFWFGKHYGIAEPRMGDPVHDHSHAATVRQCLRFYLMMEQGRLESAAACAKMKQIFAAPELEHFDKSIVGGLKGRDVTILRKSGAWEDWHLDTARVQHGDHIYLLAGMTHHPAGCEYIERMTAAIDDLLCEH